MKNKTINLTTNTKNNLPPYVNAFIITHNIVKKNSRKKQPLLTALQMELLFLYTQTPTEKQMKQLEVFLHYLLADDYYNFKSVQTIAQYNSLPKKKLAIKRDQLTPFQHKLLVMYDHEPTDLQMQQLKDFLYKLFNNLLNQFDVKQQVETIA